MPGSLPEGSSHRNISSRSVLSCSPVFFLSSDGPVPRHDPQPQRSTVQAQLIYPSAVQANLNKQISPRRHLEPLTYRDLGNHHSPVSLSASVCIRVSVQQWGQWESML